MKLNYRHSVKTMCKHLESHNEKVVKYNQDGMTVYEILEMNEHGVICQTCGFFNNASDCAEYINTRNEV